MTSTAPNGCLKLVLIIGGLSAFGPLSMDLYLPALPSLTRDLGGSASLVQLTLTACLLELAAGQVVAGPLSDALGRRRPLFVGLVAYVLASLLCALAPSVPLLVVFRLIQGTAAASGVVIARAVVRDVYQGSDVARFLALTMLISGLAPILAPMLGGQLLRVTSWRGAFAVLAAIGLLLLVASAVGLGETLRPERRRSGGVQATLTTFRGLIADRLFMGYALTSGLAMGAAFTYVSGAPFVLEDIYGLSPQVFALLFGTNALGILLLGQLGGWLVGRVGSRRLLIAGLDVASAGGLLLLAAVSLGLGLAFVLPGVLSGGLQRRAQQPQRHRPGPRRSCPPGGQRLGPPRPALLRGGRRRRSTGRSRGHAHCGADGRGYRPPRRRCRVRLLRPHPIPARPGGSRGRQALTSLAPRAHLTTS